MPEPKICSAPATASTRCTDKAVATFALPVPGGTIRGAGCPRHFEVVKRMVKDEAARRVAEAAAPTAR